MRKYFAAMALVALFAVGRGAVAAEATGWITHLDQETDQIVLDDGRNFVVSEEINFSSLKDGVKVRLRYDAIDGEKVVTDIALAPKTPHSADWSQTRKAAPDCAGDRQEHLTRSTPVPSSAFC